MKKKFITTPIYYVNDVPHIGHGYTSLIADFFNRYLKLKKEQTFFLTGTDEHGQKILDSALEKNISLKDYVYSNRQSFQEISKVLNIEEDFFIFTNHQKHIDTVTTVWTILRERGFIYEGFYKGLYCKTEETFYKTRDLINGKTPFGNEVFDIEEKCYFFKLSEFEKPLLQFYKNNPDFIHPKNKIHEIESFVNGGLEDICISRNNLFNGILVPEKKENYKENILCTGEIIEKKEAPTIYVWFDALINYITALGFGTKNWDEDLWNNSYQFLGKDILIFHGVIWPAITMALGIKPPKKLIVNGWWTINGEKISKSKKNVISPKDLVLKYGINETRFFLLSEMNLGSDGNYSEDSLKSKVNGDLLNNIGNLVTRFLKLLNIYNSGVIPCGKQILKKNSRKELESLLDNAVLNFDIVKYTSIITEIGHEANQIFSQYEPWKIIENLKTEDCEEKRKNLDDIFFSVGESIILIAYYLWPLCPDLSKMIFQHFSLEYRWQNMEKINGLFTKVITTPLVKRVS